MVDRTRVPNMLDTFMYYNKNPTPPFPGTNYWCTPEYKLTPNNLNVSEPTLLIRENRAKPGVKLAFTEKGAESDPRVFRARYGTSSDVPTRPYYAQPWLIDEIRKIKN
ncbi:unnamed protein product [Rotaria sp. Silwood2]|nr:unnamed protein product [Rotaria sp. Silwood2]